MKIVHICITNPFLDGWGYQENLLPKYMQKAGHEVHVIAAANYFPNYVKQETIDTIKGRGTDYVFDGINVHRILVKGYGSTLIFTRGLYKQLADIKPDYIFHHNVNATSLRIAARYAKNTGCRLVADNHADEINVSKNKLWVFLYYKCITSLSCKMIDKHVEQYFGVTHSRCDFLNKYYHISRDKISFLPIGADVDNADSIPPASNLRNKYGFSLEDDIVASGGKMGVEKGTDHLINSIYQLNQNGQHIKLVLFGKFEDDKTEELAKKYDFISIHGWCDRTKTLELLKLADIACWPIHHTTLCEDAISVETPLILRKTGTTSHLIDGNGYWCEADSLQGIIEDFFVKHKVTFVNACIQMKNKLSYKTEVETILNNYSYT